MIYSEYPVEGVASALLRRVFGWMTLGLALTGAFAAGVNAIPQFQHAVAHNPALMIVLVLLQIGLVLFLSFGLESMSETTAIISYLAYSMLTGVTLSTILLFYTGASIVLTFFVCAGMFAVMAIYAMVTKADLSGMGTYLMMGLFGLIIAGFVNMFVRSAQFDLITSMIGVVIFTLFTAYDVQMVKRMGMHMIGEGEAITKVSIISALKLYLDFINLFLYLLRFLGQDKNRS